VFPPPVFPALRPFCSHVYHFVDSGSTGQGNRFRVALPQTHLDFRRHHHGLGDLEVKSDSACFIRDRSGAGMFIMPNDLAYALAIFALKDSRKRL
jgi:hypothetical protein